MGRRQGRHRRNGDGGRDEHDRTDAEDPTRFPRSHALLGEELSQVEQGLMDGRADAALEPTTNLAHEAEQERPADGHDGHLDGRDQNLDHDVGELVHATTTRTITSATKP